MAKLTNSPIIGTLDHRIVEIYTLPCAPGGYAVSEQVRTAGPDGAEQPPPDRKKRKGLVVAIVGGFLTASAVVLALNGGPPFIKKDATLSIVAPAEIRDASRTLDPATSECGGRGRDLGLTSLAHQFTSWIRQPPCDLDPEGSLLAFSERGP